MRRTQSLVPWFLAILSAGFVASCSNDGDGNHETPPDPVGQYQRTFSGAFTSSAETGAITFTVTSPTAWSSSGHRAARLLGPIGGARAALGTVTGVLTFDGVSTQPVTGAYDATADTIYLTTGGYALSGRYYPASVPPHISGGVTGSHEGSFHCVIGADTTIAIYGGDWGHTGEAAAGRFGFVTKGNDLLGGMVLPNPQFPFLGYFFAGTIADGGPIREIRAAGRGLLDSLSLGGYADTSADTAGGNWDSIPLVDEIGDGWWHVERIRPPWTQTARSMH
jgi:hypothetical protein